MGTGNRVAADVLDSPHGFRCSRIAA
jgi:hypothetical protein